MDVAQKTPWGAVRAARPAKRLALIRTPSGNSHGKKPHAPVIIARGIAQSEQGRRQLDRLSDARIRLLRDLSDAYRQEKKIAIPFIV